MTPKAIDILLDASSSMGDRPPLLQGVSVYEQFVSHLNEIVRPGLHPSFAVGFVVFAGPTGEMPLGFRRTLEIEARPTDQLGEQIRKITAQHSPSGQTPLADAIIHSCDELQKVSAGSKTIIVLTDGSDQGSKHTMSAAIERAQQLSIDIDHGGLSVFGVSIGNASPELDDLANKTGGRTVHLAANEDRQATRSKVQDLMLDLATRNVPSEIASRIMIAVEIDRALARHSSHLIDHTGSTIKQELRREWKQFTDFRMSIAMSNWVRITVAALRQLIRSAPSPLHLPRSRRSKLRSGQRLIEPVTKSPKLAMRRPTHLRHGRFFDLRLTASRCSY